MLLKIILVIVLIWVFAIILLCLILAEQFRKQDPQERELD